MDPDDVLNPIENLILLEHELIKDLNKFSNAFLCVGYTTDSRDFLGFAFKCNLKFIEDNIRQTIQDGRFFCDNPTDTIIIPTYLKSLNITKEEREKVQTLLQAEAKSIVLRGGLNFYKKYNKEALPKLIDDLKNCKEKEKNECDLSSEDIKRRSESSSAIPLLYNGKRTGLKLLPIQTSSNNIDLECEIVIPPKNEKHERANCAEALLFYYSSGANTLGPILSSHAVSQTVSAVDIINSPNGKVIEPRYYNNTVSSNMTLTAANSKK